MNSRVDHLKDCIKSHLKKRLEFNDDDLAFFSIPYCLNLTGEGIENYLSGLVNISLDRVSTIAYLNSGSERSKIYDFNNSQVYEVSPADNYNLRDEYGSLLCRSVEAAFNKSKLTKGITAAVHDDYSSSSLSSPTLKFASVVSALFDVNNQSLETGIFNAILEETDKNLLSINLDPNEIPSFKKHPGIDEKRGREKLGWSDFNELRVVQISFEKKRLRYEIESNFISNLSKSHDLLKVLMASARVKSLAELNPDQINGFIRRVPAEKKQIINYLYKESVLSMDCIDSLRSKDFGAVLNKINQSGLNLIELGIVNPKIIKFLASLNDNRKILALKISPVNSSLTCFIHLSDEELIINEIQRKIAVLFPENVQSINIYSSKITGIYIYSNH